MTYQEAAQVALDIQDACNLSGVVHSFAEAVSAIWEEAHRTGKGTAWVNEHDIVTLFVDKLTDLNCKREVRRDYFDATAAVRSIANGNSQP